MNIFKSSRHRIMSNSNRSEIETQEIAKLGCCGLFSIKICTKGKKGRGASKKNPSLAGNLDNGCHQPSFPRSASVQMSSANGEFSAFDYLDNIKATFERFDVKKKGKMKLKKLKSAMLALGFEPTKEKLKRYSLFYGEEDGYITSENFTNLMLLQMKEKECAE